MSCITAQFLAPEGCLFETGYADEEDVLPLPPIKVLQNRFFKKALRPEVSGFVGTVLDESYTKTYSVGARLGFFFNEWVGFDYTYAYFDVEDSADLQALKSFEVYVCNSSSGVDGELQKCQLTPSHVRLGSLHALTGTVAPIYGKINLFDSMILYSDIYFTAGSGLLDTSQGEKIPIILGLGQRFYFANRYSVRIDGVDHIFQQERENQQGGKSVKKVSTKHAWVVSLGLSAFLW
jgi:outer membrane beta-barrel protein